MACSLSLAPRCQLRLLAGQGHGRTIPLTDLGAVGCSKRDILAGRTLRFCDAATSYSLSGQAIALISLDISKMQASYKLRMSRTSAAHSFGFRRSKGNEPRLDSLSRRSFSRTLRTLRAVVIDGMVRDLLVSVGR